jgi:hypothetical protein
MRVVRIDAARELALCEDARGARQTVETALVGTVTAGDTLLVHAGTAIAFEPAIAVAGARPGGAASHAEEQAP